jgi:hypothetical protein
MGRRLPNTAKGFFSVLIQREWPQKRSASQLQGHVAGHVAKNGKRVHVTCSRCCCSTRNLSTIVQRAWAAIMENRPPHNLARHSSLMHSRLPSKSSPAKRDTTRILTPQTNPPVASTDAFNTGLLTPQASQNTFDSDAATSLISPPPEDSARVGINHQSVRVVLPVFVLANRPILEPVLMDQS